MNEGHRVAVVGATGQVGTLLLALLRERRLAALAERDIAAVDQTTPGEPNVVFGA